MRRAHKVWPASSPLAQQAGLFVGAGVDKIRLTGGEPTLRSGALANWVYACMCWAQGNAPPGHRMQ